MGLTDGHGIRWVQRLVDSTAPVFSDGSDRVGKRRLPVRKLEEQGVVVDVLKGGQLPIDDTGTLIKSPRRACRETGGNRARHFPEVCLTGVFRSGTLG